ncbi:MAG: flagellar assembly protein FliH, partial [Acidimicrobiia bacterium]|nr:flagellar assembly protein FliH [Acidimicrobiia bacterium]
DSMEARRAHMVHALGEAIEAVDLALEHHHRAADQLAVDLALELTRLLLDRELATSDDPGREAVLRCLGEIPTGRRTMIRLNPDDLRHLEDRETLLAGRDCELVADPELRSGDAAVDFDGGSIDARLAAGLARVAEVLKP